MKTKKFILFILGLLISLIGVAQNTKKAPTLNKIPPLLDSVQYYYTTTKTFNENGYTYQCDKASYGIVTLYNKANQYTYAKYQYKDGSPIGNINDLPPFTESDNWTRQKCLSIVNNAFSVEEKLRVKGGHVQVIMVIDTSTGKVIEVSFCFFYTNDPLGTIPVTTYRKIELALKSQIWFTLTETGKKLKFIRLGWMHEVE